MRPGLALAVLCGALTLAAGEEPTGPGVPRPLPASCREHVAVSPTVPDGGAAEAAWNRSYASGFRATGLGDWNQAEREFCQALEAARHFGPRDWRFAETLDELGLVYYSLGEYDDAEAAQGAAVAELLLALGPQEPRRTDAEAVCDAADLGQYVVRLGWVWARQGRDDDVESLRLRPYEIFGRDYLPHDAALAARLEWLVSQYLRREDLDAVTRLEASISAMRGDGATSNPPRYSPRTSRGAR